MHQRDLTNSPPTLMVVAWSCGEWHYNNAQTMNTKREIWTEKELKNMNWQTKKYLSLKTTFLITMVGAWFCRYVTQGKTFLQLFSHQPKHIYTVLKLVQNQILALHIIFDREPKFKSSYLQISYGRLAFHIILNS